MAALFLWRGSLVLRGLPSAVPYCQEHLDKGDPAFKAVRHPTRPELGKILVATRDLPKGYRFIFWGDRVPWRPNDPNAEFVMEFKPRSGVIDPTPHASSMSQYAGNPGPNERCNIVRGWEVFGKRYDALVGREMRLKEAVKKNHQLLLFYGADWFAGRPDIKRADVGCNKYPAPRAKTKDGGKDSKSAVGGVGAGRVVKIMRKTLGERSANGV